MDREMLLKLIGALPDNAIMQALSQHGINVSSPKGTATGLHEGFMPDPNNKVKGWSGINLVRGKDERPKLADKDYIIEKLGLNEGQTMPGDGAGTQYARPF
jgi:hypothetical protein